MARQARTKSVLSQLSGNTKLEVGSAKVNHAIKKHVSSMVGTDIMAGEATLSNAFNNFFGTMQNTMQNMAKSAHEIDKLEATRFAEEQKRQGAIAGNAKALDSTLTTTYDSSGAVTTVPQSKADRLKNFQESETKSNNIHYNQAYKESLGSQLGADLYADMLIKSADWRPADFDTKAKEWWDKNYANGSKDSTVNQFAQAAFQKNIVKLSAEKQVQVIKENRAKIETTIVDGLVTTFQTPGGNIVDSYMSAMKKMRSIMPGQSDGAVSSRVLSAMVKGAKISPEAGRRFAVFLDKQFIPVGDSSGIDDGVQSLRQKFPSQVSQLLVDVNAANQKHLTQEGSKAVTESLSDLSKIESTFQHNPSGLSTALNEWYTKSLAKLSATVGVSSPQVQKVKSAYLKLALENATFLQQQNQLINNVSTGDAGDLTATNAKAVLGKMSLNPNYDFTSDDNKQFAFGEIIGAAVDRYGIAVIDDTLKAKIKAGILSEDSAIVKRTMSLLKQIDTTSDLSQIKDDVFGKDKVVGPKIASLISGTDTITSSATLLPEYEEAHKLIEETGIMNMIFAEDIKSGESDVASKPKRVAAYNNWLKSSATAEIFDEVILGDMIWGSPEMDNTLVSRLKDMMTQGVADLIVSGTWTTDDDDNQDKLIKSMANKLKGKVVYYNDALHYKPDAEMFLDVGKFGQIPVGNQINNPDGKVEDVLGNMNEAALTITDGFPDLNITDGGDIQIRPSKYFSIPVTSLDAMGNEITKNVTVYGIFDSLNPTTPIGLNVGVDMNVEQITKINTDGSSSRDGFSWWQPQPNSTIKFTGNYKNDLLMAQKYLNPYIVLSPYGEKDGEGKYSGYHLGVIPHFVDTDESTTKNDVLLQLLNNIK